MTDVTIPAPAPDVSSSFLRAALKTGRIPDVVSSLQRIPPLRRSELFLQLRVPEQIKILLSAPPELTASILADCDSASLRAALEQVDPAAIASALPHIPPDGLADIALHLPAEKAKELLERIDAPLRGEVVALMKFGPESAGGLMTTRYLSVPDSVTVSKGLELLRREREGHTASYIYVVDSNGRLVGTVPLRELLLADPRQEIRSVVRHGIVRLDAAAPREEIVRIFNEHHFISLPVVDEKERLVGIVTFDEILEAMRRGKDEIVHGVTGADPKEAARSILSAVRGRLPWITMTLVGGLGCTLIASRFQRLLAEVVVLGFFIPVVLALAESVAAQTLSVVLSAGAGGGVDRKRTWSFAAKQAALGLFLGAYAGTLVALVSHFWHGDPNLGVWIGAASGVSVAWASLLGLLLPRLMNRFRIDPVIASGPLTLALTDLSTLGIYLGGGTLWLLV